MAPVLGAKKRKATSATSPQAKKSKTTTTSKAITKTAEKAARGGVAGPKKVAPRKTAADFYSDDSNSDAESEDGGWDKLQGKDSKGKKKDKKASTLASKDAATSAAVVRNAIPEPETAVDVDMDEEGISLNVDGPDSDSESEDEDQTATLLQGFESSDDEDAEEGNVDPKELAKVGIPNEKKVKKKLEELSGREKTTPGIVYLGRVPHGFYEHEMRAYFTQFGRVIRLRLSRNKKTGKSKHYAFIEFSDEEVAQIVADTMNNYLLFGHILKCKVVPRDNIEYVESLFKGANKRFKPRPAAKLAKALLEKKKPEEVWTKKLDKENRKRKKINPRLQSKGIDYEFEAPVAEKAATVGTIEPAAETPVIEEKALEVPVVGKAKKKKSAAKKGKEKVVEEKVVGRAVEQTPIEVAVKGTIVEKVAVESAAKKKKAVAVKGKKAPKKTVEKTVEEVVVEEKAEEKAEKKPAEKPTVAKKAAAKKGTKKVAEKEVDVEDKPAVEEEAKKKKAPPMKGAKKAAEKVAETKPEATVPRPAAEISTAKKSKKAKNAKNA